MRVECQCKKENKRKEEYDFYFQKVYYRIGGKNMYIFILYIYEIFEYYFLNKICIFLRLGNIFFGFRSYMD